MIDIRPPDLRGGRLQQLIETAAAGRPGNGNSSRVAIALPPGRYTLEQPITLHQHSNLTLRGSPEPPILSAALGSEKAFDQGLIVPTGANNVTITDLELELPQVPAAVPKVRPSQQQDKAFAAAVNALAADRHVSIGIWPVHCAALTISDCLFRFTLGTQVTTPSVTTALPTAAFGVGVFGAAGCVGLHLERNRFLQDPPPDIEADGPQHALAGYLLTLTTVAQTSANKVSRQFNGSRLRVLLDDAVIRDNTFDGLRATVVLLSDLGTIRIWDSPIRRCYGGIWLTDATTAALTDLGGTFNLPGEMKGQVAAAHALATGLLDPVLLLLTVCGRTFPLPGLGQLAVRPNAVGATDLPKFRAAGEQARQEWMTRFVNDVAAGLTPATPSRRARARATTANATVETAPTDFNQGICGERALLAQGGPFQQQLQVANASPAALTRLGNTAAQPSLMLRIERNDVECGLGQPTTSGPATFVYISPQDAFSTSAEVIANRVSITGTGTSPAAALLGVTNQTITGNLITAASARTRSLVVAASPHVAITGNVITGTPLLPANRPFPAFGSWPPLNSVI